MDICDVYIFENAFDKVERHLHILLCKLATIGMSDESFDAISH